MDNKRKYYVQFEGAQQGVFVDEDSYNARKDQLYKEHPNAVVQQVFDYDPLVSDQYIDKQSSFVVQFDGAERGVSVPYDNFMERKDKLYKEHPNATVRVVNDERGKYWRGKEAEAYQNIGQFESDPERGKWLDEYQSRYDAAVEESKNLRKVLPDEFVKGADRERYFALKQERENLRKNYYSIPTVGEDYAWNARNAQYNAEEYDKMVDESTNKGREDAKSNYRKARRMMEQAAKTWSAPSKYDESNAFYNYAKGMVDAVDLGLLTLNLSDAAEAWDVHKVYKKLQDSVANLNDVTPEDIDRLLTPSETALIKSYTAMQYAEAKRAEDMSIGYSAGLGATDALAFMAQFAMSGAISKGVGVALSKSENAMLKWLSRELMTNIQNADDIAVRTAQMSSGRAATYKYIQKPLTEAMTKMWLQPATYNTIFTQMNTINDDGQLMSTGSAILSGVTDALIEVWSEGMGGAVDASLGGLLKGAGTIADKAVGGISLGGVSLSQLGKWAGSTTGMKLLKEAGFNGLIGEIGEEWIGNAARLGLSKIPGIDIMSGEEFKDFASLESQLEMAASFGLMTGISTVGQVRNMRAMRQRYAKNIAEMSGILERNGVDSEDINELFNKKFTTPQDIAKVLAPYASRLRSEEDYKKMLQLASDAAMNGMADGFEEQVQQNKRDTLSEEYTQQLGTSDWQNGGNVRQLDFIGTNGNSTRGFITSMDSDGNGTAVMEDGTHRFIDDELIANGVQDGSIVDHGTQELSSYLDTEIEARRRANEKQRMADEQKKQMADVKGKLQINATVNLGTEESPIMGTIIQIDNDGNYLVQSSEDGSVKPYRAEQLAQMIGTPIDTRTDEQIDAAEANHINDLDKIRTQFRDAVVGTTIMHDGVNYTVTGAGEWKQGGDGKLFLDAFGKADSGYPTRIPLTQDEIAGMIAANEASLQAEIEEDNNEDVPDIVSTPEDDGVLRDFRGAPIPLKADGNVNQNAFWNKDPEAWAKWNDDKRNDGGENTKQYVGVALNKLIADRTKLDKVRAKETDFDKIEEYENQIVKMDERIATLQGIIDSYNPKPKVKQTVIEMPASNIDTEAESSDLDLDELDEQLGEPDSWQEYVTRSLPSYKFVWANNTNGTRGLGSHTISDSEEERMKRISWLANRDKGGLYPEEVAENIYNDMPEGLKQTTNVADILDHIIDDVLSNNSPGAAIRRIYDSKQDAMRSYESYLERRDEMLKDEFAQAYGFESWDEYEIFEEVVSETFTEIPNNKINEYYNSIYGSENNAEQESAVPGVVESAGKQTDGNGTGTELGITAETDNTGGTESEGQESTAPRSADVVAKSAELTKSIKDLYETYSSAFEGTDIVDADKMTDDEKSTFVSLINKWESVNDKLGELYGKLRNELNSSDKVVSSRAKSKIADAQDKADKAFEPFHKFYDSLVAKYNKPQTGEQEKKADDSAGTPAQAVNDNYAGFIREIAYWAIGLGKTEPTAYEYIDNNGDLSDAQKSDAKKVVSKILNIKKAPTTTNNKKAELDAFGEYVNAINIEDAWFPKAADGKVEKKQKGGKHANAASATAVIVDNDLFVKTTGLNNKEFAVRNANQYGANDIIARIDDGIGVSKDQARLIGDAVLEVYNNNGWDINSHFNYNPNAGLRPAFKGKNESKVEYVPSGDKNRNAIFRAFIEGTDHSEADKALIQNIESGNKNRFTIPDTTYADINSGIEATEIILAEGDVAAWHNAYPQYEEQINSAWKHIKSIINDLIKTYDIHTSERVIASTFDSKITIDEYGDLRNYDKNGDIVWTIRLHQYTHELIRANKALKPILATELKKIQTDGTLERRKQYVEEMMKKHGLADEDSSAFKTSYDSTYNAIKSQIKSGIEWTANKARNEARKDKEAFLSKENEQNRTANSEEALRGVLKAYEDIAKELELAEIGEGYEELSQDDIDNGVEPVKKGHWESFTYQIGDDVLYNGNEYAVTGLYGDVDRQGYILEDASGKKEHVYNVNDISQNIYGKTGSEKAYDKLQEILDNNTVEGISTPEEALEAVKQNGMGFLKTITADMDDVAKLNFKYFFKRVYGNVKKEERSSTANTSSKKTGKNDSQTILDLFGGEQTTEERKSPTLDDIKEGAAFIDKYNTMYYITSVTDFHGSPVVDYDIHNNGKLRKRHDRNHSNNSPKSFLDILIRNGFKTASSSDKEFVDKAKYFSDHYWDDGKKKPSKDIDKKILTGEKPVQKENGNEVPKDFSTATDAGINRTLKGLSKEENDELARLKAEMAQLLKGSGRLYSSIVPIDPDAPKKIALGTRIAFLYIKSGIRQFKDFCDNLISDMGDQIRPYLKSIYNAVRDYPGSEEFEADMTSYDEVKAFDVMGYDKSAEITVLVNKAVEKVAEEIVEADHKAINDNIVKPAREQLDLFMDGGTYEGSAEDFWTNAQKEKKAEEEKNKLESIERNNKYRLEAIERGKKFGINKGTGDFDIKNSSAADRQALYDRFSNHPNNVVAGTFRLVNYYGEGIHIQLVDDGSKYGHDDCDLLTSTIDGKDIDIVYSMSLWAILDGNHGYFKNKKVTEKLRAWVRDNADRNVFAYSYGASTNLAFGMDEFFDMLNDVFPNILVRPTDVENYEANNDIDKDAKTIADVYRRMILNNDHDIKISNRYYHCYYNPLVDSYRCWTYPSVSPIGDCDFSRTGGFCPCDPYFDVDEQARKYNISYGPKAYFEGIDEKGNNKYTSIGNREGITESPIDLTPIRISKSSASKPSASKPSTSKKPSTAVDNDKPDIKEPVNAGEVAIVEPISKNDNSDKHAVPLSFADKNELESFCKSFLESLASQLGLDTDGKKPTGYVNAYNSGMDAKYVIHSNNSISIQLSIPTSKAKIGTKYTRVSEDGTLVGAIDIIHSKGNNHKSYVGFVGIGDLTLDGVVSAMKPTIDEYFKESKAVEQGYDANAPFGSRNGVVDFMKSIGYTGTISNVINSDGIGTFVKYQANGVVTPNIVFGETTPMDVFRQFFNYGNVMNVTFPDEIHKQLSEEKKANKETSDSLWKSEEDSLKDWLDNEGITYTDVIQSERGLRIVFSDDKNTNGNYTDWLDVSDLEDAKEKQEEIEKRQHKSSDGELSDDKVNSAEAIEFSAQVREAMVYASKNNVKVPFPSIVTLRDLANSVGLTVDADGKDDILLQELVENALVAASKWVLASDRLFSSIDGREFRTKDALKRMEDIYVMQPTISRRSSNRIIMQQYSTPLPMSFVAQMFALGKNIEGNGIKILEPTAGNGMLVYSAEPKLVHANELDKTRLENLKKQGFADVTNLDATIPFEGGKKYDVILANPPFGQAEAKEYDGKMISGLDPQITINALNSMKDNGKAAIIVGGNIEYANNGSIKSKKAFFSYLYDHYNVKGIVDMDGQLYKKQGTTFPTMMILIDGRRSDEERAQSIVYPPLRENAPKKAMSFTELYDIVSEIQNNDNKTNGTEFIRQQQGQLVFDNERNTGNGDTGVDNTQHSKNDRNGGRESVLDTAEKEGERRVSGKSGQNTSDGTTGRKADTTGKGSSGKRTGSDAVERVPSNTDSNSGNGLTVKKLDTPEDSIKQAKVEKRVEGEQRQLGQEKMSYKPHNGAFFLESVAPSQMVEAMDNALTRIEAEYGNIDDFLVSELGYDSVTELHNALAAEQVDSVAMAIAQMKEGKALIIGDQTGVGKGRQMAALIRWACKQGSKPVFITQKADLFTDIYRDLVDVGSGDLKPFIFNSDGAMLDNNGNAVYKPLSSAAQKKVFEGEELPSGYDFAVLTYSQVNTGDEQSRKEGRDSAKASGARSGKVSKKAPSPKATFLRKIAYDNYMFLDESHTAAGTSNTGAYLQSLVKDAKACTFASATFAKRPDTMPLYAIRTAMSEANIAPEELIDVITKGGVTLQEIMSRALSDAGQMVRRERDMSDVITDWKTIEDPEIVARARKNYDTTIEAFNAIIDFQEIYINPIIALINQNLGGVMSTADNKKGTKKMGVENVPFASKTYNYTKQLMLALKTDAIVDEVEQEIKAGRHPVIALESTMEASINDYSDGETIAEPTFASSLIRGLDTCMQYTVKDADNNEKHYKIEPSELGEEGEKAYNTLRNKISESTKDIFISPLDGIISKLNQRGYKVGELTGRNKVVDVKDDGTCIVRKRTDKDKKRMMRDFNSGALDVLILNKSASTGISLHASNKFSDQRQRSMIIAQPLSDINDYMQMIGRIDRTGQVHRGYYINLGLPVPAENRFLMMLSTKLKSLNANTTSSQDSESNSVEAPDLLNKYGAQVIVEFLRDNIGIYEKMGNPLKIDLEKYSTQSGLDAFTKFDDETSRKVTGYVALLKTEEQEQFYNEVVERYAALIKYLDETNANDLKITVMPLRAKTIDKRTSSQGKEPDGNNPFAQDAYCELVEMDVLRKPMKASEVTKTIENITGDNSPSQHIDALVTAIENGVAGKIKSEDERYASAIERSKVSLDKIFAKINADQKMSEEDKASERKRVENETNEGLVNRHQAQLNKIEESKDNFIRDVRRFTPGRTYVIGDDLYSLVTTSTSAAIFCGYKFKADKVTPSTTTAVFAVLDGRRKVELKMSDVTALSNISSLSNTNWDVTRNTNINNWDSQIANEARKQGYIMTGNIIQAVNDTKMSDGHFPGQLISYTDEQGGIHDGILMPEKWNPSLLGSSGVPINTKTEEILSGKSFTSVDNKVVVEGYRWMTRIYVPKTKKDGQKYYSNPELLKIVGSFSERRGKFFADIYEDDEVRKVINILSSLNVRVSEEDDSVHKRLVGESTSTIDTSDAIAVANATSAVNKLASRLGVPVKWVSGTSNKGAYREGSKSVEIDLANAESIDDVIETYLHETVAHFGLRKLLGNDFNKFIDAVYNNGSGYIREKIDKLMANNGWDRAYATEEYIAELAQKTDYNKPEMSFWRKVKAMVVRIIEKLVGEEDSEIEISEELIKDLLVSSYKNLENAENGEFSKASSHDLLLNLYNDNTLDYERVNELVRRITQENTRLTVLPVSAEKWVATPAQVGGRLIAGAIRRSNETSLPQTREGVVYNEDLANIINANIISWAESEGHWFDSEDITENYNFEPVREWSAESQVFIDSENKRVIKLMSAYTYGGDLGYLLDSITMFNDAFPGTAYNVIGFSENENGDPCLVVIQNQAIGDSIDDIEPDDTLESHHAMMRDAYESLGASGYDEYAYNFSIDDYYVHDAHGGNIILVDGEGYVVIDANVYLAEDSWYRKNGNFDVEDYHVYEHEGPVHERILNDKRTLDYLNGLKDDELMPVVRSMQIIENDGKRFLVPPMSGKVNGEWQDPIEIDENNNIINKKMWIGSDERPDMLSLTVPTASGKSTTHVPISNCKLNENGEWMYKNLKTGEWEIAPNQQPVFYLDKTGKPKDAIWAAYNPYGHYAIGMLNDQFSQAQDRDNLVSVRFLIPKSELNGEYKAQYAKDATGEIPNWKAGVITSQLTGTRGVILSRWGKPVGIVPNSEVADDIYNSVNGKDIIFPSNVVPKEVRKHLEAKGVKFVETDNQGHLKEGKHKGDHYSMWYAINPSSDNIKKWTKRTGLTWNEMEKERNAMRKEVLGETNYTTGKPATITAYHGTVGEYSYEGGVQWLSPDRNVAKGYAEYNSNESGFKPVVKKRTVSLNNPLVIDAEGATWSDIPTSFEVYSAKDNYDESFKTRAEADAEAKKHSDAQISVDGTNDTNELAERAKKEGYDGLIITNVVDVTGSADVPGTSIAIFSEDAFDNGREHKGWHGTSYDFDSFDNSHIGEGEGSQVHGWGTYIAFDPKTSKKYAESTGTERRSITKYKGMSYEELTNELVNESCDRRIELEVARELIERYNRDGADFNGQRNFMLWHNDLGIKGAKSTISDNTRLAEKTTSEKQRAKYLKAVEHGEKRLEVENKRKNAILALNGSDFTYDRPSFLYEVEIPEDSGDNYIYEDKPLPERAAKAFREDYVNTFGEDATREEWDNNLENSPYKVVRETLAEGEPEIEKMLSERLNSLGYVGIKYTGSIDGDCAVIFNDKDVIITDHTRFRIGMSANGRQKVDFSFLDRKKAALDTAKKLGVEVSVVTKDDMPAGHEDAAGLWNKGKIYVCPDNCIGINDTICTVIHEAIGHEGISRLVGKDLMRDFCMFVYRNLSPVDRRDIINMAKDDYNWDIQLAIEEFLAITSERLEFDDNFTPTIWQKIRDAFRILLDRIGINVYLDDDDLRYIFWQSRQALKKQTPISMARTMALANRLGKHPAQRKLLQEVFGRERKAHAEEVMSGSAARLYNKSTAMWFNRLHEVWVDKDNAVNNLVEAIEKSSGKKIQSFEDVRYYLNQQGSKGLAAITKWEAEYWNPLKDVVEKIVNDCHMSVEDIERYMMIKHGLERNEVFAKQFAIDEYKAIHDAVVEKIRNREELTETEREQAIKRADASYQLHLDRIEKGTDPKYRENRKNDYGGLTGLYSEWPDGFVFEKNNDESEEEFQARVLRARKPMYEDEETMEAAAVADVALIEKKLGSVLKDELWKRTNAATKETLRQQYVSNMISRKQYDHIKDMFEFYVPLRGFKDNTAEDMYTYYMSTQNNDFVPPLVRAKGRKTEADSPFGYIGSMASSGIAANLKNETKLALYYMASNRPDNDILRISDVWYEKVVDEDGNPILDEDGRVQFNAMYPSFNEDLSSEEAKEAYDTWEAGMKAKAKNGLAFKGTKKMNLRHSVIHIDENQKLSHLIRFKVGGEEKMMFINGNPRAAQSINNELNVEVSADYRKVFGRALRFMSSMNTSWNPEFWISNAQRDLLFALMSTNVKEDKEYNKIFHKNLINALQVAKMSKALKNGTLGDGYVERMYREFSENGAITGATVLKGTEEWESEMRKMSKVDAKKVGEIKKFFDGIQMFGESVEQMTRFAAYMTSREIGRDIRQSVSDAKELTVNFNRKGSGKAITWKEADNLRTKDGKKLDWPTKAFVVGASWIPVYGRRFIMFFNAAVQGLNAVYKLAKADKRRTAEWASGYLALGVLNGVVHALVDDDDDYLDMPDWERRNNAMIGFGGGYLKYALPQECRVFYGMGDMIVNHAMGREPNKSMIGEVAQMLGDISPLNMTTGLASILPAEIIPVIEVMQNKGFSGARVYNDNRYMDEEEKKRTPKYNNALPRTSETYIKMSQMLNFISGGDKYDAGSINWDPNVIQHLISGYTGGVGTTALKVMKFASNTANLEFNVNDTPLLRRIFTWNDERYRNSHVTDLYYYYKAEALHTQKKMQELRKDNDTKGYTELLKSYDFRVMQIYNRYKGIIGNYDNRLKYTDDEDERRQLMRSQDSYRKAMINEISNTKKTWQ